ncbi:MAG: dienelactone hydrolase family protein [Pseudomonadales bacterium]
MSDAILTETIHYAAGDTQLRGYVARPDDGAQYPGVLVVHEWWGLNDYPRRRAEMLAAQGYTAMAIDMYGTGTTADSPDDALGLMQAVLGDTEAGPARFQAALQTLRGHAHCNDLPISAIGYCFGGAVVLAMARAGLDLASVASFHGSLQTDTPAQPNAVKARVLVCHGNDDAMIPADHVQEFKKEMTAANTTYEFVGYDGAEHGFSNAGADEKNARFGLPVAYNEAADLDSWSRMLKMLAEVYA